MEELVALLMDYAGRLLIAMLIWLVGSRLIKMLLKLVDTRMDKRHVDESLHSFVLSLLKMTLQVLMFLSIASTLGAEITSFVAIMGAASFAVGLAFQGSLANFAGGVLILLLKPFQVGDFIEASGYSGTVREIQVFYTILNTPDNRKVIIPNSSLSNSSAINYSVNPTRRIHFEFAVRYDEDIQKVKDVIRGVVEAHPLVLDEPAPMIVLGQHGENALIMYTRVWCNRTDYWTVYYDILEQVTEAFAKADIEIPFRQVDVHMKTS